MKILKIIGFVLLGLVAVALIAALILPKNYAVEVSHTYNKPKNQVYDYVKLLSTQKQYSEWLLPDPNIDVKIEGTDGEVGAKMSWKGNDNVGEGSQEIIALDSNKIDVNINFIKPMASEAKLVYDIMSNEDKSTTLKLKFSGESPFPLNLLSHLVGGPMIKSTTEKNFKNIEKYLK